MGIDVHLLTRQQARKPQAKQLVFGGLPFQISREKTKNNSMLVALAAYPPKKQMVPFGKSPRKPNAQHENPARHAATEAPPRLVSRPEAQRLRRPRSPTQRDHAAENRRAENRRQGALHGDRGNKPGALRFALGRNQR